MLFRKIRVINKDYKKILEDLFHTSSGTTSTANQDFVGFCVNKERHINTEACHTNQH